jgi:hypothetical protein
VYVARGYIARLFDALQSLNREHSHVVSILPKIDKQFQRHRQALSAHAMTLETPCHSLGFFAALHQTPFSVRVDALGEVQQFYCAIDQLLATQAFGAIGVVANSTPPTVVHEAWRQWLHRPSASESIGDTSSDAASDVALGDENDEAPLESEEVDIEQEQLDDRDDQADGLHQLEILMAEVANEDD